jgi:hypothetical protein
LDRILIYILFALILSSGTFAQIAPPVHEIQLQFNSTQMLNIFNTGGTLEYRGMHTICGGGPVDILVPRVSIVPQGWIMPGDGRYGLALTIDLFATLHFHSDQWGCGFDGDVRCHTFGRLIGPLGDDSELRGECASVSLGAAAIGFKVFDAPQLFQTGEPVYLPKCDEKAKEKVCFQWAQLVNGKYVVAPADSRSVRFAGRLTGNPIVPVSETAESAVTVSNYIGANIHVGLNSTALSSLQSLHDAEQYVSPNIDQNLGFKAVVSLDALSDDVTDHGAVRDPGILRQILPINLDGSTRPVLGFGIQYDMFLDKFGLFKARLKRDDLLVLEGNGFKAKLYVRLPGGLRVKLPLFKRVRARVLFDSLAVAEDGSVRLKLHGVELKARALFGVFSFTVGGAFLNQRLTDVFSQIPVIPLSREFDLSIPKCIVLDDSSSHDLDNCTGNGVMKHVAGYRGARATLRVTDIKLFVDRQTASISGSLDVSGIGVNDK